MEKYLCSFFISMTQLIEFGWFKYLRGVLIIVDKIAENIEKLGKMITNNRFDSHL